MKKLSIIICTLLCFVLFLCSCDSKEPIDEPFDDIVEYTVTFHVDSDDITTKEIKYELGTHITLELIEKHVFENKKPEKFGYTMEDWYYDSDYTKTVIFPTEVSSDLDLYLNWTRNYVSLKFYTTKLEKNATYFQGEIPTTFKMPTKSGYVFDGWYIDEQYTNKYTFIEPLIEDTNLYGRYVYIEIGQEIFSHKIKYFIEDELYFTDNTYSNINLRPVSNPIKEGYTFDGWYIDNTYTTKYEFGNMIFEDINLYGRYISNTKYNLNYYVDDELYKTIELGDNIKTIELPALEKYDYKFDGWYTDNTYTTKYEFGNTLTKNTNVYGKFIKLLKFNVNFYFENELIDEQIIVEGNTIVEPYISSRENYISDYWYLDSNYTNKFDVDTIVTKDLNLYSRYVDFNLESASILEKNILSAGGYVYDKLPDFTSYENTSAYRKVTTVEELVNAIKAAKYTYTTIFYYDGRNDEEKAIADRLAELDYINRTSALTSAQKTERTTLEAQALALGMPGHIEQELVSSGTVHVIEIMNDLNLGYYTLSQAVKDSGVISDFVGKQTANLTNYLMSDMFNENGMSQIQISNTTNLLIYSKNGAKLTHGGFQILSSHNIVIRNLEFDELWQWEDASINTASAVGNYDAFGWAYFKISFSGYVWIDHCTFGKSYDGQIDYSNPIYNVKSTSFRAPYGTDGVSNGLHISWCNFNAGSDDQNGYLYKMMDKIEKAYIAGTSNYLYYNKLRSSGVSFEEILYGLAIPQKKGFLLGDSGSEDQKYNYALNVSFANCKFLNIEDRLPKLRGGNCYMYNCLIDNSLYFKYRSKLEALSVKDIILAYSKIYFPEEKDKNSLWKCALASQGLVISQGGSVKAENCIFKGIKYFIKNNDTGVGGFELINCIYENIYYNADNSINTSTSFTYKGSSSDENNKFNIDGAAGTQYFKWNTKDELQPFNPSIISLDLLENYLNNSNYYSGVNNKLNDYFIICYY
ncbi:MAG: hypothetical protein E7176_00255 [Erysipelotrichaceae bacterium]|nr:hypothetical protein [Erysipelotrichaceae bacterium]